MHSGHPRSSFCYLTFALCCGLALSARVSAAEYALPESYSLVFADEFDRGELDRTAWAYRVDNKHRSIQREENVSIRDGALRLNLVVFDEPVEGKHASGAGVVSQRRFRYGYFEVRARLGIVGQQERGWHHSFWAMAASIDDNGYVATSYPAIRRTEIDCYENPTEHRHERVQNGLSNFSQHVIVWNAEGKEAGRLPKPPSDVTKMKNFDASQWHTYGFHWTPETIKFTVDGEVTKVAEYPSTTYEHDEVNLWLTAISANWNADQQIASLAEYDYIRVYQAKD